MSEHTSPVAPAWYCPGCGQRYFGPGLCSIGHPPTELFHDDEGFPEAAVRVEQDDATSSVPSVSEETPAAVAAASSTEVPVEPAPPLPLIGSRSHAHALVQHALDYLSSL